MCGVTATHERCPGPQWTGRALRGRAAITEDALAGTKALGIPVPTMGLIAATGPQAQGHRAPASPDVEPTPPSPTTWRPRGQRAPRRASPPPGTGKGSGAASWSRSTRLRPEERRAGSPPPRGAVLTPEARV
jgi:hypothetical protein